MGVPAAAAHFGVGILALELLCQELGRYLASRLRKIMAHRRQPLQVSLVQRIYLTDPHSAIEVTPKCFVVLRPACDVGVGIWSGCASA